MIFVTVGGQMPFDRLVRAVDAWAGEGGGHEVFGQIGNTDYRPKHFPTVERLPSREFRARIEAARCVVSHAGIGTILTALELGKPLIVLPRLGRLGETRNDHQVATARWFAEASLLVAAADETELVAALGRLESSAQAPPAGGARSEAQPRGAPQIGDAASPELLERIRGFVR